MKSLNIGAYLSEASVTKKKKFFIMLPLGRSCPKLCGRAGSGNCLPYGPEYLKDEPIDSMKAWDPSDLGPRTRGPGCMRVWGPAFWGVGSRVPGYLGTWRPLDLGTWGPGHLGTWAPGHLGTWAPGHLGTWAPGHLGHNIYFH